MSYHVLEMCMGEAIPRNQPPPGSQEVGSITHLRSFRLVPDSPLTKDSRISNVYDAEIHRVASNPAFVTITIPLDMAGFLPLYHVCNRAIDISGSPPSHKEMLSTEVMAKVP